MAEAILTPQEEQEVVDALESSATAKTPGGPLDIFCKNWATLKQALEFLAGLLPEKYAALIKKVIRIGDLAHDTICPGK